MLLTKLPLELVQDIIALSVQDQEIFDVVRMREVNHLFDREVIRAYSSLDNHKVPGRWKWSRVPISYRLRWSRSVVGRNRTQDEITSYMHDTVDYLEKISKAADPDDSGLVTREQWLNELCEIMAPYEADCQCGRPAFRHPQKYNREKIRETAFHVAILKRRTALEIAMIEDGMCASSGCPYIQVHRREVEWKRRNALEWAVQQGLVDTVQRLVADDETKRAYTMWNEALRIAAMRGNMPILDIFLQPNFFYTFTEDSFPHAIEDAAAHRQWPAVHRLLAHPACTFKAVLLLTEAAKQGDVAIVQDLLGRDPPGYGLHWGNRPEDSLEAAAAGSHGTSPQENRLEDALEAAAAGGHVAVYRLLFEREVPQLLENEVTIRALNLHAGGSVEILKMHREAGLSYNDAHELFFDRAVQTGNIAMAEYLVATFPADFATPDPDLAHALVLLALAHGQLAMAQWLVARSGGAEALTARDAITLIDANFGATATTGTTPLIASIDAGNVDLVRWVLATCKETGAGAGEEEDGDEMRRVVRETKFGWEEREARVLALTYLGEKVREATQSAIWTVEKIAPQWRVDKALKEVLGGGDE
ncbi:hypothetical protein BDV95DRAFT_587145 [Massariosphaeria phaeospora]|uniref:Ankyrin repeat-containing domain protein n=1 Tax=Massariosphaeria phaeospora TaxID=100035 RepID=A0A7C8HYM7_9PLEO|nr:hypothetical protein BDV95DRAFT_587145 [Massariosphaeria phaeospora]